MSAEGPRVELLFGALIDNGALVAREGRAVLFRLEEILTKLRPDMLEDEADMGGDRVVAQDRMASLDEIAHAEKDEGAENGKRQRDLRHRAGIDERNRRERQSDHNRDGEKDVARSEGQQQITHELSLARCGRILGEALCQFYKIPLEFTHRERAVTQL